MYTPFKMEHVATIDSALLYCQDCTTGISDPINAFVIMFIKVHLTLILVYLVDLPEKYIWMSTELYNSIVRVN